MKDNFSKQSETYAKFRPTYPSGFIDQITSLVSEKNIAWDCGTGNGQVAKILSKQFKQVIATDISSNQLSHAPNIQNIEYRKEPAESTSIESTTVDLITVAQAIHWFNFDAFFEEVNRVLRADGVIAIFGYPLLETRTKIDTILSHFYSGTLKDFWDSERRFIEDEYSTIPFPFQQIEFNETYMKYDWTFDQMIGYLRSWSAVQHYITKFQSDPVELIQDELISCWPGTKTIPVSMKIINKIGRKN